MSGASDLIAYDSDNRVVKEGGLNPAPVDLGELIEMLDDLRTTVLHCSEKKLCRELSEWARYRAVFRLLPEQCLYGKLKEYKPLIRSHLGNLGVGVDETLVSAVMTLCVNFRSKRNSTRKLGISDVRVRYPNAFTQIMKKQGERCFDCGVPLSYGENATLDHVLPYHLGDDPTSGVNWRFLCADCNIGKGVFPTYAMTAAASNWLSPDANSELSLSTRYAALSRDGQCTACGCRPSETELTVVKVVITGCWILDNVKSLCQTCVDAECYCEAS